MDKHNEILEFINNFKKLDKTAIENVFLNGNCYWFSVILTQRFKNAAFYYLPVENHFITKINKRFYDITGEITEFKEQPVCWEKLRKVDPIWTDRIFRYCVQLKQ